ncbi:MAG: hypothetical protein MJZ15_08450, partial [Bacteroidales bacterium]|nr:hypothetical protein [Bacteroidales bacterium]
DEFFSLPSSVDTEDGRPVRQDIAKQKPVRRTLQSQSSFGSFSVGTEKKVSRSSPPRVPFVTSWGEKNAVRQ